MVYSIAIYTCHLHHYSSNLWYGDDVYLEGKEIEIVEVVEEVEGVEGARSVEGVEGVEGVEESIKIQ